MKTNKDQLLRLKEIMKSLATGKDPISGIDFPDDTILNSKILQHAFKESANIFDQLSSFPDETNLGKPRRDYRSDPQFYLTETEYNALAPLATTVNISEFTEHINQSADNKRMKKLTPLQITKWLTERGYLKDKQDEYKNTSRVPTNDGSNIGITTTQLTSEEGVKYNVNYYNPNAQSFIIKYVLPEVCVIIR